MIEANIVEEKEITKPEFKSEIKAKIKKVGEIEDNIQEAQDYALKLNDYYSKIVFTEETLKEATDEKAKVNKFKDEVKKFKKEIIDEYNKPIDNFKRLCDKTISLLEDTYKTINEQVKAYDEKTIAEYTEIIKNYFYEYAESKKIDFVLFEDMNFKVLKGSLTESKNLTKKTKDTIESFIDKIVDDIALINSQQYIDEMMIEYKKDLNVSKAITEVNNRHIELEKVKQEKEEKKEQKLTDEMMLNKIESLSAPKIKTANNCKKTANELQTEVTQNSTQTEDEELISISFKVIGAREKVTEYVKFFVKDIEERGLKYEQIK